MIDLDNVAWQMLTSAQRGSRCATLLRSGQTIVHKFMFIPATKNGEWSLLTPHFETCGLVKPISEMKNLHWIEKGEGAVHRPTDPLDRRPRPSSFDFDCNSVNARRLKRRLLIKEMSDCYLLNKQTKEQRLIPSPLLI